MKPKALIITIILLLSVLSVPAFSQGPPAVAPGLQITIPEITAQMANIDPAMVLKPRGRNFYAQNKNDSQLIIYGTPEQPTKAVWTAPLDIYTDTELEKMKKFMYMMGKEKGVNWLHQQFTRIIKEHEKKYIPQRIMLNNNRRADLFYELETKKLTLTFSEW